MRIDEGKLEFQPIAITLETQAEAELMHASLAQVAAGVHENNMIHRIYNELDGKVSHPGKYKAVMETDAVRIYLKGEVK